MENENVLQTLRLSPSHSAALTWSDGFTSNASDPSNENESVTLCDAYEAIDTNLSVNSKHVQQICAPADYLDRCCSQDLEIQVLRNELHSKQKALVKIVQEREICRVELENTRSDMEEAEQMVSSTSSLRRVAPSENAQNQAHYVDKQHPAKQHVSWVINRAHPRLASPTSSCLGQTASTSSSFDIPRSKTRPMLPKRSRFDYASIYNYAERKQNFWKSQYEQAIRWRSTASVGPLFCSPHSDKRKAVANMEIFTHPRVKTRGYCTIDEKIPQTRYIGISVRQSELVREYHRILR